MHATHKKGKTPAGYVDVHELRYIHFNPSRQVFAKIASTTFSQYLSFIFMHFFAIHTTARPHQPI